MHMLQHAPPGFTAGRAKPCSWIESATRTVRIRLVSSCAAGSAGANFSVNLSQLGVMSRNISHRTEVQLETGCVGRFPFRVATFNVLADGLAQSGDFVKEIRAADADIVCLQELNHFDTLATMLVPEGYSCFFRAKQPSPALKFGFPADGIALFYRHSRFSCSPAPAGHCFDSIDGQPAAQGFVTAQLHDKLADRTLIVAATHLKAKAGFENEQTRVHQACQLLQELKNMHDRFQQMQLHQQPATSGFVGRACNSGASGTCQPPAVLVCGDFNTTPDSDTVEVIQQHQLKLQSIWDVPWTNSTGGNGGSSSSDGKVARSMLQPVSSMRPGSMSSSNGNGSGAQQQWQQQQQRQHAQTGTCMQQASEFTTWKFRSTGVAKRTIDYIWFSKQQLTPISRWRMLTEEEIGSQGLPNVNYPSDHMCVTCEFGWM